VGFEAIETKLPNKQTYRFRRIEPREYAWEIGVESSSENIKDAEVS
jgi:hypothetical protein